MLAKIKGFIKKSVLDKKDGSGTYTLVTHEGLPLMFLSKVITERLVDGSYEEFEYELSAERRSIMSPNGIDMGKTETVLIPKSIVMTEAQLKRYSTPLEAVEAKKKKE